MGDTPRLFPVLRGLINHYQHRGQLQTAYQLGEQMLSLAQSQSDPALVMIAHYHLGTTLFFWGELAASQTHHTQALTIYHTLQEHRDLALRYGLDLGVTANSMLGWELWQRGYPNQALQHSQAACALAQKVSHPYSLATALFQAAILHRHRCESPEVQKQAAATTSLTTKQGFAERLAWGKVLHGWALAMEDQIEVGITEIRQGLAAELATGAKLWQPYFLSLLAEAYGEGGHAEEGLHALAEAVDVMDETETRFYGAELYRLQGELRLTQVTPDQSQAEAYFYQAIEIARLQEAKSWELRAAMSLARLWQQQNKRQEAYDLLAPVYEWFTEGFDTADLVDAKALLDGLNTEKISATC